MPVAAMSIARCGASWAASTNSCAPCAWASVGELLQRPDLAGDVGGAGDREQVDPALLQRARRRGEQLRRREVGNGSMRRSCRRHGSMFAWCSTGRGEHAACPAAARWRGR